jgi:hypothetical protein
MYWHGGKSIFKARRKSGLFSFGVSAHRAHARFERGEISPLTTALKINKESFFENSERQQLRRTPQDGGYCQAGAFDEICVRTKGH